jgi:hypothetical protein
VELALVGLVDVGDRLLEERPDQPAVGLRVAQLVLRVGDLDLHRAGGEALGVDVEIVQALLDQPPGVGRVVDRELARVAEPVGVGAQHACARRMERHDPHGARRAAHEQLDALAHLLRRLVGERDREDLVRARLTGSQQVGDPVRQHPRLARPRAGEDQQRAGAGGDRLALRRIEALEQGLDAVRCLLRGHAGHASARPGRSYVADVCSNGSVIANTFSASTR